MTQTRTYPRLVWSLGLLRPCLSRKTRNHALRLRLCESAGEQGMIIHPLTELSPLFQEDKILQNTVKTPDRKYPSIKMS